MATVKVFEGDVVELIWFTQEKGRDVRHSVSIPAPALKELLVSPDPENNQEQPTGIPYDGSL